MRTSSSSADRPASTANGSIGVWRKRDFFFIRVTLYAFDVRGSRFDLRRRSKGPPDARVERRAAARRSAVVPPRCAAGERQRQVVPENDVGGEFAADGGLDRARVEGVCPRVARVDESGAVN